MALETRAPSRKLCRNTLKGYCVRATSRRSAFSLLCGNFSEPASRRQGSRRAIFAGSTLASQKLALDTLADSSQNTASSEKQKNSRHRAFRVHCFTRLLKLHFDWTLCRFLNRLFIIIYTIKKRRKSVSKPLFIEGQREFII